MDGILINDQCDHCNEDDVISNRDGCQGEFCLGFFARVLNRRASFDSQFRRVHGRKFTSARRFRRFLVWFTYFQVRRLEDQYGNVFYRRLSDRRMEGYVQRGRRAADIYRPRILPLFRDMRLRGAIRVRILSSHLSVRLVYERRLFGRLFLLASDLQIAVHVQGTCRYPFLIRGDGVCSPYVSASEDSERFFLYRNDRAFLRVLVRKGGVPMGVSIRLRRLIQRTDGFFRYRFVANRHPRCNSSTDYSWVGYGGVFKVRTGDLFNWLL